MLNLVANGPSGYNINNSLRFRSSASAYLNRTPASAGNRQTWTWSSWVKRGSLGSYQALFNAFFGTNNIVESIRFTNSDTLEISYYYTSSFQYDLVTTQVFRDPSAWYHIVVAFDSTQATASNRVKVYVNGSQITSFSTATYPPINTNTLINGAYAHYISTDANNGFNSYFDGYQTEINFIDGQALTPSSFGSTNSTTGVWQPAKYTGTYGTNGFYLNFSNIALTSGSNTGLGKDNSGNGNYWNTNNISVTAGTTYDAMTDVPTLTSATVANYPVLNGLNPLQSGLSISNGNLRFTNTNTTTAYVAYSTFGDNNSYASPLNMPTKYYFEATVTQGNTGGSNNSQYVGLGVLIYRKDGTDASSNAFGATYTTGDVIGISVNLTTGEAKFYKNNVLQGTQSNGFIGYFNPIVYGYYNIIWDVNFGQQPFVYTPPTGFVALNTYNLPTSTIVQGNKYMDATLYTGNGSTQSITNTAGFKPDLVWVKSRSAATDHKLTDSNRGATKALISDSSAAETTDTNGLTAFNSNGWSLGTDTNYNNNTATYVGWQWQAGQGSTSSNTNGSITSTVSVNASAGFSVATYTGTGANATVGHGLGVTPKMVIVKSRSNVTDWVVWQTSLTGLQYLNLDQTSAVNSIAAVWNSTIPTSSVINLGTNAAVNNSGYTFVAYCWASIPGFSAFGSYTGNGSTDGSFIYTGFRPKYVMVKRTDAIEQWLIYDTSRSPYNLMTLQLAANSSSAEASGTTNAPDFVSNGIKWRGGDNATNASGGTYIYAAFAENPFKNALAR
jgi:hypothetical protein